MSTPSSVIRTSENDWWKGGQKDIHMSRGQPGDEVTIRVPWQFRNREPSEGERTVGNKSGGYKWPVVCERVVL